MRSIKHIIPAKEVNMGGILLDQPLPYSDIQQIDPFLLVHHWDDKLDGGIAIICLQKNPGQDTGLGGYRSMEVARLVIALDSGRVKITKAKNYRTERNPNGLVKNFKLVNGCQIIDRHDWQKEEKE